MAKRKTVALADPQVAVDAVLFKQRLSSLGLHRTAAKMDAVTTALGWELALPCANCSQSLRLHTTDGECGTGGGRFRAARTQKIGSHVVRVKAP